jgi:hypothetical protein
MIAMGDLFKRGGEHLSQLYSIWLLGKRGHSIFYATKINKYTLKYVNENTSGCHKWNPQ